MHCYQDLSVFHNSFDDTTKLFQTKFVTKFLDTSANPFFPCEHLCSLKESDLYITFESEIRNILVSMTSPLHLDRHHPSRDIVIEPRRRLADGGTSARKSSLSAGGNKDAVRAAKEGRYCASVELDAARIVAAMLSGIVHIYYRD